MKDLRHIRYDLNDYDFRPGAEIQIARVEARISFDLSDSSASPKPSINVRYFDAEICPAHVFVKFNVNQFTKKKPVSGQISLSYDLGKCKTNFEVGSSDKLEATMYVLNTDVNKAQDIIKHQMLLKMKDVATVVKNVTAGIKALSKEHPDNTPEP